MAQQSLKWFTLRQNNSGGYFMQDENVSDTVCIQAESAADAIAKAGVILNDYRDFCECCGERWGDEYIGDEDGTTEPALYGEKITEKQADYFNREATLHYADGTIEKIAYRS